MIIKRNRELKQGVKLFCIFQAAAPLLIEDPLGPLREHRDKRHQETEPPVIPEEPKDVPDIFP